MTVSANPTTAYYGQQLLFTTTVSPASPGLGTPTGTASFSVGTTPLPPTKTLSGGSAFVQTSPTQLQAGTYTINAVYSGDSNFIQNSGSLTNFVVNPDSTSVLLTSSANPAAVGASVTFTAVVNNTQSGSSALPAGGTVTFTVDGISQDMPVRTLVQRPGYL